MGFILKYSLFRCNFILAPLFTEFIKVRFIETFSFVFRNLLFKYHNADHTMFYTCTLATVKYGVLISVGAEITRAVGESCHYI